MGNPLKSIGNAVSDAFEDTVDFVSDAANDLVDFASDSAKFVVDATMTVTGWKYIDEQLTGGLAYNSYMGTIDNVSSMASGAINGDWTQFRDGTLGVVVTVVAVAAIVAGALTGNYWAVAAGIIMLDAQHNEGELLRRSIDIAASVETAVFNSRIIENYAVEIQMLITVTASLYGGYIGGPFLFDQIGLTAAMAQWSSEIAIIQNIGGTLYGSYQIYSAIQSIKDSQAYWKEQLRAAYEHYRKLLAQAQAAKNLWFDMMTNPDMINRIQAGGDLFNLGAGHDLFSVTSVAEPRFALGLIDKSDPEMDKLMNNRYFGQSAGSDGFRVN